MRESSLILKGTFEVKISALLCYE